MTTKELIKKARAEERRKVFEILGQYTLKTKNIHALDLIESAMIKILLGDDTKYDDFTNTTKYIHNTQPCAPREKQKSLQLME